MSVFYYLNKERRKGKKSVDFALPAKHSAHMTGHDLSVQTHALINQDNRGCQALMFDIYSTRLVSWIWPILLSNEVSGPEHAIIPGNGFFVSFFLPSESQCWIKHFGAIFFFLCQSLYCFLTKAFAFVLEVSVIFRPGELCRENGFLTKCHQANILGADRFLREFLVTYEMNIFVSYRDESVIGCTIQNVFTF